MIRLDWAELLLIVGSFGFALLVWAASLVNNVLYLVKHRRLLRLLRERWPGKWIELGEPKLVTFGWSFVRNTRAIQSFLKSPGVVEDAEIAGTLKQVKSHLVVGRVGFVVSIVSVLLAVFLLLRAM